MKNVCITHTLYLFGRLQFLASRNFVTAYFCIVMNLEYRTTMLPHRYENQVTVQNVACVEFHATFYYTQNTCSGI